MQGCRPGEGLRGWLWGLAAVQGRWGLVLQQPGGLLQAARLLLALALWGGCSGPGCRAAPPQQLRGGWGLVSGGWLWGALKGLPEEPGQGLGRLRGVGRRCRGPGWGCGTGEGAVLRAGWPRGLVLGAVWGLLLLLVMARAWAVGLV